MKRFTVITFVALFCSLLGFAAEKTGRLEAFPGAEGYGRYTSGGRFGKVYKVTTLDDNNQPGSFRYAINQSGTRTIVFEVSGTIHLTSALDLRNGNVTIAGQTAPGDGICVADYPFNIAADNVIIRFIRFRLGNKYVTVNGADGWDGLGSLDHKNIIVDHCSVCWSIDECLSFSGTSNTTVQWCIVSQSLVASGHSKGAHGYGGNWGGEYASYHHNLLSHHTSRCPRLGPRPTTQLNEVMDMRNNVMFNYSGESCYGGEGMNVNILHNYYKPGPGNKYSGKAKEYRIAAVGIRSVDYCLDKAATANSFNAVAGTTYTASNVSGTMYNGSPAVYIGSQRYVIADDNTISYNGTHVKIIWNAYRPALHLVGTYFVDGNYNYNVPSLSTGTNNWDMGFLGQITWSEWDGLASSTNQRLELAASMKLANPISFEYTTTHQAATAYDKVLAYAGASLKRDAYDAMIVNDARNNTAVCGTGSGLDAGFINVPEDVRYPSGTELEGCLPVLKSTAAPVDSDGDGMPDAWENANGLNPNDASDGAKRSASGFTNLEVYMNSLVQDIMTAGLSDGKLLNGQLTINDAAVELPVFDASLYDPAEDPNKTLAGGEIEGETFEVTLSNSTYIGGDDTKWEFADGFKILINKGYAAGSSSRSDYIKISRNVDATIVAPEGKVIESVTFEGWSNYDDAAYLATFGSSTYGATDYVFPGKSEAESASHTMTLADPANSVKFRIGGQQATIRMTVKGGDGSSAIDSVIADQNRTGNGKTYNIMGVEVSEPLQPGIYIRDGKKFIVR